MMTTSNRSNNHELPAPAFLEELATQFLGNRDERDNVVVTGAAAEAIANRLNAIALNIREGRYDYEQPA